MANNTLLKKTFPHIVAFLIFLILPALYFAPQLSGKVVPSGDTVSATGMSQEITSYHKATGERSWWTNSMFGGMPAYQVNSSQPSNVLTHLAYISTLYIERPIGSFFGMCLTIYALMVFMGISPWLSIIGSVCFSFSTGNVILFEAGHMSKLRVIAFYGMMLMGIMMVFRKNYLPGAILFSLGLGLSLFGNHVQMIYYFFMALIIFGLIEMVRHIRNGKILDFSKATAFLFIAGFLALGSSASKLWTTYEYSKDTMRGDPILISENNTAPKKSSELKGLDWEYAMQWSNSTLDLLSVMVPGLVGGGSQEEVGTDSELYQDLRKKGANLGNNFKAPLYWGTLPFTSGPFYFGAVICFLFILGVVLVRDPLKWWLVSAVLLLFLISMGKHFGILNRLLFDYFPLFDKFRTPNSALTVAGFFIPILGMLSLSEIIKGTVSKQEIIKALKIATGITGGLYLFFALIGASMFNMNAVGDGKLEQAGYSLQALLADRQSLLRSDSIRSLILTLLTGGLIWAFVQEKIKQPILLAAIGVLAIGDLWLVNKRYLDDSDFISKTNYQTNFTPRPVDQQILADTDPNYRVLDLSINTFNDASSSYFHKTIGGYHAAKLQRYQDVIERHLSTGNQGVLAMLNTKYVISQDQQVQRFPGSLGNAWLVKQIQKVKTPNEELAALTGLNPGDVAVVHEEYNDYVGGLNPTGEGTISLTEYRPNRLTYQSNSSSEELAVFSEIWYGPDKGWEAYIDGNPVDHIRTNYILRALKVPAGQHVIEFKFEPQSFYTGETISLICSLLITLGFLILIGWKAYEFYNNNNSLEELSKSEPVKAPLNKTTSRKKKNKKK